MKTFTVKDLMINVVPQKLGSGGVSLPGPDADIADFPPANMAIIMVAKYSPRLRVQERVNLEVLENMAMEAGKAALAGALVGTAQCTVDMPTCVVNQFISPVASMVDSLRFEDLVEVKAILNETLVRITDLESSRLAEARQNAKDLAPKLEAAAKELRGSV